MKNEQVINLKETFGDTYQIELEGAYKLERTELRDPIEWYYVIPAKYGYFFPYGDMTIALYCIANRIKEQILRQFDREVTLFVEAEDESILLFDQALFSCVALIAKAKKKRGRKTLSEIERKTLAEAGKGYQFRGKSLQHRGPGEQFPPQRKEEVVV